MCRVAYALSRLCIEPLMYCTEPLSVPDGLYTEPLMCGAAYVPRAAYVLSPYVLISYVLISYVLSPTMY